METLTPEEAQRLLQHVELQTQHLVHLQSRIVILQATVDTALSALAGIMIASGTPKEQVDAEMKQTYKQHLERIEQSVLPNLDHIGAVLRGEIEVEPPPGYSPKSQP